MRQMVLLTLCLLIVSALAYAGMSHKQMKPMSIQERLEIARQRLASSDVHTFLNARLEEELLKRLPNHHVMLIREFPRVSGSNRLTIDLQFNIDLPFLQLTEQEQDKAIAISIPYTQAFVDTIHNVPEIRPFLAVFPLPLTRWGSALGFGWDQQHDCPLPPPYIASVIFPGNRNRFLEVGQYIVHRNGSIIRGSGFRDIYDNSLGPIPEAFKNMEIPQYDEEKIPRKIPQIQRYRDINSYGKGEFEFARKCAKINNLVFIAYCNSFAMNRPGDKRICSEITYATQEKYLSIEETRALLLQIQKAHVQYFYDTGRLKNYVMPSRKEGIERSQNPIDAQKYISFRISFWDAYIDRVKAPFVAEVQVYGKRVRYYVADELQRLKLVLEEEMPAYEIDIS